MMNWSLAFDYATILLLSILVIWFLTERRVPLKSTSVYFGLVVLLFVCTTLEIFASYFSSNPPKETNVPFIILMVSYSVVYNLIAPCFAYYMCYVVHMNSKTQRIMSTMTRVSIVVVSLILILNPFLDWAYYYDEAGNYHKGFGVYIINASIVLMIGICIVCFTRFFDQIRFTSAAVIVLNVIICIVMHIIQQRTGMQMTCFSMAICLVTLYHYLHNPGVVMDTKTNLYNRDFMGEYIRSGFSYGGRFGVIVVAMDDFKFINKTYGVDTGDELLIQIGRFLKSLGNSNVVFRFGSDQFCVVLRKHVKNMSDIAETIHERFLHPWYSEAKAGAMMSASICCIECPKDADSYGELIEVIDYSMAVAKKTKKGGISWAVDVEIDKIRGDKAVEKAVKLAMDRDDLMVYYQPIYSISDNRYNSAEALVRLKDDELGWISPEKFIPIAEKNGLIVEMGEMIFEKVCKFIHDNNLKENGIEYIEVNISPVQLIQVDFADRVKSIMEKYGVTPDQINIEITETASIASMSVVKENINKLVEYGISFSLDDYGSGSSNIEYINRMPFKIIKLDKYIVWDAFKNDKAGITLEYTIGMLNALKLLIVAEGVETAEMRDKLTSVGCHYMQGWYYSKAVSDKEFMNLIQQG
ncbi:MAG: phosphodiesterase [Lachnospiraceae bacterium]|nr:phosphodiesterase [Lachnospiraceae bacterium]